MSPGLSLGEILGAALAAEPCPPVVDDFTFRAALAFSGDVADRLGVTEGDVFDALTTIPDNMLPMLGSPEGWTVLASFIAADFGTALNAYNPTIH